MSLRSALRERVDATLRSAELRADIRELLDSEPSSDALVRAIEACPGGWAIDAALARVLVNAVTLSERRRVISTRATGNTSCTPS